MSDRADGISTITLSITNDSGVPTSYTVDTRGAVSMQTAGMQQVIAKAIELRKIMKEVTKK